MIDINYVIKETSKRSNVDINTAEHICKHVFKFTIDVMKSENDVHDILFAKLFRFKLKPRFKENKTLKYNPK